MKLKGKVDTSKWVDRFEVATVALVEQLISEAVCNIGENSIHVEYWLNGEKMIGETRVFDVEMNEGDSTHFCNQVESVVVVAEGFRCEFCSWSVGGSR
jgi:hypothetical protein